MDEVLKGFALTYFKRHKNGYSFTALARQLGIPILKMNDVIDCLLQEGMLAYNEVHMLSLTPKGRLAILDQRGDSVDTSGDTRFRYGKINPDAAIPLNQVYVPEGFMDKLK